MRKRTDDPSVGFCQFHRKWLYPTRRYARRQARLQNMQRVREYTCAEFPDQWHLGHLPAVVRTGQATATEIYQPEKESTP
jgi:hypothetical protein